MVVGSLYDPVTGMIRLGLGLILLIIVFALSRWKKLDIERDLGIAAIRGFCQLMLLSIIITAIFDLNDLFLVLLVLVIMATAGGYTSARRAKGIPKMFSITLTSILIGSSTALAILILIGLIPLQPEFLIPLGGMAIGNSMIGCSLTINRLKSEFKNNRNKVETALALGATSEQAGEPYFRASVKAALIPTIDNLKTLGIIFIPGAMTGMLIAGADVIWAAEYQIAVFLMIMSSKSIAIIILSILIKNRLFTEEHQLNESIQLG
jgi:putative ABC transport system permease protein